MKKLPALFLIFYLFAGDVCAQNDTSYIGKTGNEISLSPAGANRYTLENPFSSLSTLQPIDTGKILQVIKNATHIKDQRPDSVLAIYKNTLAQSKLANFTHGIISSLGNTGNVYYRRGFYDKSISLYKQAIPICFGSEYGMKTLSSLYNGLGLSYQATGRYDTAINCYYKAIGFAENIPSSYFKTDLIYSNLSIILIQMGRYDKALQYLNKEEYQCIRTKKYISLCYIYANKSNLYSRMKQWDKCLYYAQQAIKYDQQYNMSTYTPLVAIGYYYLNDKTPTKALPYFLKALSLKDDLGSTDKVACMMAMGETYMALHNYKLAEKYLLNALDVATTYKMRPELILIHASLSGVYENLGDYKQAYEQVEKYAETKDSIESVAKSKDVSQLEIKYQGAEKDKELMQKQGEITKQQLLVKSKNIWLWSISVFIVVLVCIFTISYRNYRKLQAQKIKNLQQEKEMSQLKAMLTGEEKERSRIGQELHDGIGGLLTAAKMNLNAIQERYIDVPQMKALNDINNILNQTAIEVRKTAHNLMPDILMNYTLAEALQMFCEPINKKGQLQIDLHFYGELGDIPKAFALPIYRIVQELIQNIVKHAGATLAEIQIRNHENIVSITIEDNGKGFDMNYGSSGIGLKNIYSRVQALQGNISIESVVGTGTIVRIILEVKNENIVAV